MELTAFQETTTRNDILSIDNDKPTPARRVNYRWPIDYVRFDHGRLWVRRDLATYFEEHSWLTAESINQVPRTTMRHIANRENGWLELTQDDQSEAARVTRCYIKWHRPLAFLTWLRNAIVEGSTEPAGLAEAGAVGRCQAAGVPTLSVMAAGINHAKYAWQQSSFFLSENLCGMQPADEFWRDHLAGLPKNHVRRRLFLERMASVARRFHAANLYHRDFYWCHFFAGATSNGFDIAMIDLQRVRNGGLFPWRWRIKDIAQFLFSTPTSVTREERLYWWQHYSADAHRSVLNRLLYALVRIRARFYDLKERRR